MSDHKIDVPNRNPEKVEKADSAEALKSPEVQSARNASGTDMATVETTRTNASDGSLRKYSKEHIAALDHSIEVIDGDKIASRKSSLKEKDLSGQPQPDDWLHVMQKVAALPLDQQLKVVGAGLTAGLDQYAREDQQRKMGQLIGTVQGIGDLAVNMASIADFAADVILNHADRLAKNGQQFGDAVGQTIVGGVQLFRAADQYVQKVGATGDYAKPFNDIAALGQALDHKWSQMSPLEQERIKAKLITELVGSALLTKNGAGAIKEAGSFTEILDTIAADSQHLYDASKTSGKPLLESLKGASNEVSSVIQDILFPNRLKLRHAAEGVGTIGGAVQKENTLAEAYTLESRVYTSKLDPRHRLTAIEAAQQNAHLKGQTFDKEAWKKLTPTQKNADLVSKGYEMLENPEPVPPLDSSKLDTGFRGDAYLHSPVDAKGMPKSHLNANGDLVPANVSGINKGELVTVEQHVLALISSDVKANSPYTSIGTEGVLFKYGAGKGIGIDMVALRQEIAAGKLPGVEILNHQDLIKQIENSKDLNNIQKMLALRFLKKDGEFLIKGIVPARFIVPVEI